MLQVKNISKKYTVGELTQTALNDVSLSLRDSEFVSILGPSGSGKTTLLNIIGGLDRYDDGDLIINGVSTKNYKDRDWDTYRNHTIGFVFQSYNLIGHQSILSNVELALTIGGVTKSERRERAKQALTEVGLAEHIHKKPNQLSGGQMQRVAIARALVNNPDIVLADEPTGALDTETSVQIMDILKNIAKEKLVVMVTHNPELAEEYSTRIIKLKDGKIVGDTDEFVADKMVADSSARNNVKKAKMSLGTSLSLSLSNLSTKKRRTFLTAFAGSIGIIGIALILSLSNGVNSYIEDLQKDTMSSYPLTISDETMNIDMGPTMPTIRGAREEESSSTGDEVYSSFDQLESANEISVTNNLTDFKAYIDDESSEINQYLGETGVHYSYDTSFSVYAYDADESFVNTDSDPSELLDTSAFSGMMGGDPMMMMSSMMGGSSSENGASNFSELLPGNDGEVINNTITDSYDIVHGAWPENYDEVVLVVGEDNTIAVETLYQLGLVTDEEYVEYAELIENDEDLPELSWTYEDVLNQNLYLLTNSDKYVENENGTFTLVEEEELSQNEDVMDKALELKIVGVVKQNPEATEVSISTTVAYTTLLTDYIIEHSNSSDIVTAQNANSEINVLTGVGFEALSDDEKISQTTDYLSALSVPEKSEMYSMIMYLASQSASTEETTETEETSAPQQNMGAMQTQTADDETMAAMLDTWLTETPDDDILLGFYDELIGGVSYEENLNNFGNVSYDTPSAINIYTDSFEDKEGVALSIENYNSTASEDNQIVYTDFIEALTSSMTTMIDTISYVLIAFVAVSLVVSCIMVGIITHISVIERTKEIGVLRALGASKKNVSQVFNAETLIIGLCSGLIGILATLLINIPINAIIQTLLSDSSVSSSLPFEYSVILLAISVVVTIIGGLLPAKKAATKDPVLALRSE